MYPAQAIDELLTSDLLVKSELPIDFGVILIVCYRQGEFMRDEFPSYIMLVLPICTVYVEMNLQWIYKAQNVSCQMYFLR